MTFTRVDKPKYRIPSMEEIRAIPDNGLRIISTFSGCGGSCLGFRMDGYRTLWASEFIPAAADTYRANYPDVILDTRDIREVNPESVLRAIGLRAGDVDVMEGSPPCASFSTSGNRNKDWGTEKSYSGTKQRTDDLFFEYARLIRGIQPKVFVAENVSGLVKGVAKGYFKAILAELKSCGYRVDAKLLDAQWLGVPQARQRIIFIGVREDLNVDPVHPEPLPYNYSLAEAIDTIDWERNRIVGGHGAPHSGKGEIADADRPCPTLCATASHQFQVVSFEGYAIDKEWRSMLQGGNSARYQNLIRPDRSKPCPTITAGGGSDPGKATVVHPVERRKFTIAELRRICAFPDDFVLTGNFTQQYERLGRAVPPLMMYHVAKTIREKILRREAA